MEETLVGNAAPLSYRGTWGDIKDAPQSDLSQGQEMRLWPLAALSKEPSHRGLTGEQRSSECRREEQAAGLRARPEAIASGLGCWGGGAETYGQGPSPCFCFTPAFWAITSGTLLG